MPKKYYQESEEFIAELLGLELQPGSGNQVGRKGDMRGIKVLLENKCTKTVAFHLRRPVMLKIAEEAMLDGRVPMLSYHSVHPDLKGAWVMLPSADFKDFETWPLDAGPEEFFQVTGETYRVPVHLLIAGHPCKYGVQFVGLPHRRYRWWRMFHIWEPESRYHTRKGSLAQDFRSRLKGDL